MLSPRAAKILNSIVSEYITRAIPVPSQVIAKTSGLDVSSATVRNEMVYLEQEGFLIRPHTSAGCIPSDKGYRHYVESIGSFYLPQAEERYISHTLHQAEKEVETWLSLTATLLAGLVQNMAVVSMPRSVDCKLKHMELLSVQDSVALAVVVLYSARVKQKLISFGEAVTQSTLTTTSNKLNAAYSGLTCKQIVAQKSDLTPTEQHITDQVLEMMRAEDTQEYEEPFLDGWHFMLKQPEFAQSDRMRDLMELVERRSLLRVMLPSKMSRSAVHVIIGKENQNRAIQNCSVVISQYGLPDEATGTIGVVGPTRMPYSHTISSVQYLSSVLSELVAHLYGKNEAESGSD